MSVRVVAMGHSVLVALGHIMIVALGVVVLGWWPWDGGPGIYWDILGYTGMEALGAARCCCPSPGPFGDITAPPPRAVPAVPPTPALHKGTIVGHHEPPHPPAVGRSDVRWGRIKGPLWPWGGGGGGGVL